MTEQQQKEHDAQVAVLIARLTTAKGIAMSMSTAGLIVAETLDHPDPKFETSWFYNSWGNASQRMAVYTLAEIGDNQLHGLTEEETDNCRVIFRELGEHFTSGLLFFLKEDEADPERALITTALFWGSRISALGLLEMWKKDFRDDREANLTPVSFYPAKP